MVRVRLRVRSPLMAPGLWHRGSVAERQIVNLDEAGSIPVGVAKLEMRGSSSGLGRLILSQDNAGIVGRMAHSNPAPCARGM